jgi:hypothetical protein
VHRVKCVCFAAANYRETTPKCAYYTNVFTPAMIDFLRLIDNAHSEYTQMSVMGSFGGIISMVFSIDASYAPPNQPLHDQQARNEIEYLIQFQHMY